MDTIGQLTKIFGEKKAKAIFEAVGETAAAQIVLALDPEESRERVEDRREKVVSIGKDYGVGWGFTS